jgi:hemerythrin-like domain-containing protein
MEEQVFYPQLQKIPEMQEMAQDALEEHKEAKEYLSELDDTDVEDEEWFTTFQDLQEGILHHVQGEENEIFPECKRYLNDQQFNEIYQKCVQIKEESGAAAVPPAKGRSAAARKQQPGSRQR